MFRKPITAAGKEKLAKIKGTLKEVQLPDFKPTEAFAVAMNEYAITDSTSATPIVGSPIASACLLIGLYDSKNKRAGCAHAVDRTEVQSSLGAMVKFFSPADTVAHLAGGCEDPELCLEVVEFLEKKGIRIVNAHIDFEELDFDSNVSSVVLRNGSSIALDARTGVLYSPVVFAFSLGNNNLDTRMALMTLRCLSADKLVPMLEIFNSTKIIPEEKKKEESAASTKSSTPYVSTFSGLRGGFLNNRPKAASPVATVHSQLPATAPKEERLYSGLRGGFLNKATPSSAKKPDSLAPQLTGLNKKM